MKKFNSSKSSGTELSALGAIKFNAAGRQKNSDIFQVILDLESVALYHKEETNGQRTKLKI